MFDNFIFGCDRNSTGFGETVARLFGFGPGNLSVVSQVSARHGKAFSYCIPASPSVTGHITFGSAATSTGMRYTPILTKPPEILPFYFVDLLGVSIFGQRIDIQRTSWSPYDTLMDSGTTMMYLHPTTYEKVKSAFMGAMSD